MKKWSASNYRANKAKRLASIEPEWITNPETGSEFYLRRVGTMAAVISGYMRVPGVADEVVTAWQEKGLDIGKPSLTVVTPEKVAEGERELRMMARIVSEACVIPKLVPDATGEDELDPSELDDRDVMFIFRYATGQAGSLKGGGVVNMADLKSLVKKPGRRARARSNGAQLRDAPEQLAQTG